MHPRNRAHCLDLWKHSSAPAMLALQPITYRKSEDHRQKESERKISNVSEVCCALCKINRKKKKKINEINVLPIYKRRVHPWVWQSLTVSFWVRSFNFSVFANLGSLLYFCFFSIIHLFVGKGERCMSNWWPSSLLVLWLYGLQCCI